MEQQPTNEFHKLEEQQQQGGGGGGSSSQNTAFQRQGTTNTQASRTLPSALSSLFTSMPNSGTIDPATDANQTTFLGNMLKNNNQSVPGGATLSAVQGIDPQSYSGKPSMASTAAIDPQSGSYEAATNAAFLKRVNDSIAQAQSGTDIVRGGTARQGFRGGEALYKTNLERAEELRRAKVQDFGMANAATNTQNTVESSRRGQQMQSVESLIKGVLGQQQQSLDASGKLDSRKNMAISGLAAALEALGIKNTNVQEALQGSGSQNGSQSGWEAGVSCCFIFLEVYNGHLPWWVRMYRDAHSTPRMVRGYNRLAKLLVPLMRRFGFVSRLVNNWMVLPLTLYGAWFYKVKGYERCESYSKYKRFWFFVYNLLGV